MKIVVGSKNPVKVDAVKDSVKNHWESAEIFSVDAESGVSDQPLSLEEIQRGAINRAKRALAVGAEWGVGIEAGIVPVSETLSGYVDVAWCAIIDKDGLLTLGSSPQFEWPPHFVEKAKEGVEMGILTAELSGDPETKRKEGGIGLLSKGMLPRKTFCEMAVICALLPRLNRELYRV